MATLSLVRGFLRGRRLSRSPRAVVRALQERRLRETLVWTYDRSLWYRNLWRREGIQRNDLAHVPLAHLPVVTKRQLMDNFEEAITASRIRRRDVEYFLDHDPSGQARFARRYHVLHTSGSSGVTGIHLFTPSFWFQTIGLLMGRLIPTPTFTLLTRKTRAAFIGETSGHHAGVSMVRSSPSLLFDTLSISVSASADEMINTLREFKPHILLGYASGLSTLADAKHDGNVELNPEAIISSGEPLTPVHRARIQEAFGIRPLDFYSATEALGMGADLREPEILELFDDHVLVECVDDSNRLVPRGEPGRVVLTVFGNRIQPLVRYALDDELVLKPETEAHPFTRAEHVMGRNLDRLVFSFQGRTLEIHPMDMVGLFFPGLRRYQIVQTGPTSVKFRLVIEGDQKRAQRAIDDLIQEFLAYKQVPREALSYEIEFVDNIAPNPKTGKTPIVVPLPHG